MVGFHLLAPQAGARKVYAVEASDMASAAKQALQPNDFF